MRIQHNIMAMNAYRNYNNNTSALAKNLEKLSSGYRINRAGDDAAGLAISEKMRAQITALGTAQKNVKDGISLVKTAEGATQEIHDMLNRMVDLATQSANGTYKDDVDREAIQDEFNSLKTEIDRITKASNFNGITLLNGDLSNGATRAAKGVTKEMEIAATSAGNVLGTDTILHQGGAGNNKPTSFKVDLSEFSFAANDGESMTVKVGDNTFKLTAGPTATGPIDGENIAKAITAGGVTGITVQLDPGDGSGFANYTPGADIQINGQAVGVTASGNKLVFTQKAAPTKADEQIDGKMDVVLSGVNTGPNNGTINTDAHAEVVLASDADNKADFAVGDEDALTAAIVDAGVADGSALTLTYDATGKTFSLVADGKTLATSAAVTLPATGGTSVTVDFDDAAGKTLGTLTLTRGTNAAMVDGDFGAALDFGDVYAAPAAGNGAVTGGDYNVQTIEVENGTAKTAGRLASTVVELKEEMFGDGAEIRIGDTKIAVSAADADKNSTTKVYIGDMVGEGKTLDLSVLSERLSKAAAGNNAWTVSAHAGTKAGITLMEKTKADGTSDADAKWDLTTEDGIKATLGYTTADTPANAGDPSKGLKLQIGEDSMEYNQLTVSIDKIDSDALGLNGITLANQKGAQDAVDVIKTAINTVSTVRGQLGATQNRLEHTANNLSTMKENIQDAEATIRDTDIAEEMMAYTKNNILVQSAQAMLAQANQIPQGVLQLLG